MKKHNERFEAAFAQMRAKIEALLTKFRKQ